MVSRFWKYMKNIRNINLAFHFLFQELFALIYWRIKYLKLKYGLSLLKIHEKYKKYIFRIIFYISLIKNDTKENKLTFLNHLLAPTFLAQNLYILTALHLFIPLMIMISSELCLNEYQWISKL